MAQSLPNTFRDTTATAARAAEVPAADFTNGMNNGSCSPGAGVAFGQPDLDGEPQSWTLLDQHGPAGEVRVPQVSQLIGGAGYVDRSTAPYWSSGGVEGDGKAEAQYIVAVTNPTQAAVDGDSDLGGTVVVDGTANLQTLAVGWTHTPI
jgi:hypothetical protein